MNLYGPFDAPLINSQRKEAFTAVLIDGDGMIVTYSIYFY